MQRRPYPFITVSRYVCRPTVRNCPHCDRELSHSVNVAALRFLQFIRYEYLWEDGVAYKRPTKLSAPDYMDKLMNWVQARLDDESVFPHKIGTC